MKLTTNQKDRVIEILKFHQTLIGVDREECERLIMALSGKNLIKDNDLAMDEVLQKTVLATGVSLSDMMSQSRVRNVVMARSFAIFKIVEDVYMKSTNLTYNKIGELFGIDHSTVIQAHRRIKIWIQTGDRLTNIINDNWNQLGIEEEEKEAA